MENHVSNFFQSDLFLTLVFQICAMSFSALSASFVESKLIYL